jgi:hypothetical protein
MGIPSIPVPLFSLKSWHSIVMGNDQMITSSLKGWHNYLLVFVPALQAVMSICPSTQGVAWAMLFQPFRLFWTPSVSQQKSTRIPYRSFDRISFSISLATMRPIFRR